MARSWRLALMGSPRSLAVRLCALVASITFILALYTYSSHNSNLPSFRDFFGGGRKGSSCSPEAWNSGHWIRKPGAEKFKPLKNPNDTLTYAGWEGCASTREIYWHLASDTPDLNDRFPEASSWMWSPGKDCNNLRPLDGEALLRDLVEQGGWLLIGDSITEGQFFSLSCILYPHVLATPNYTANPYFDRAWPQNLYLSPTSPLLPTLSLPHGFSIEKTPLVTFRRVDLLMNKTELEDLYGRGPGRNWTLFSDEQFWSVSPSEYMGWFMADLPEGNYATLVASTAGHWTTGVFAGLRDETKKESGSGIDNILSFFEKAMDKWASVVQDALDYGPHREIPDDLEDWPPPSAKKRQVVVRAYLPGHEDCHDWREPWEAVLPFKWEWYNWPWIQDFNAIFQKTLADPKYPDIHYLGIDRPARLRPDAHASGDCLHVMCGAGVLEGWSHYIWHYVTREIRGRRVYW